MQWIKADVDKRTKRERWVCLVPPDNRLRLEVLAHGDGRWSWQIFARDAVNPMASGVARNFGAAKAVTEQFATRNP